MTRERSRFQRRAPSWRVAGVVLLLHLAAIAVLVRAFTPQLAQRITRSVTQAFTIEAQPPVPPSPAPAPEPSRVQAPAEGAASAPGRRAIPRAVPVPRAPVVVIPTRAPPIAGAGTEDAAGAAQQGSGTGASGTAGNGTGAGGAAPTVKITGDINSARDYPKASRDLRVGSAVVIDLGVGVDGRVSSCRIVQPSPDSQADRITCDLATRRFRFRPAKDAGGRPVEAVYRWRQRWYY